MTAVTAVTVTATADDDGGKETNEDGDSEQADIEAFHFYEKDDES